MTHRDTISEMLEWEPYPPGGPDSWMWYPDDSDIPWVSSHHPIPNTIDFISAAWPDGCIWRRDCGWISRRPDHYASDSGNELADRQALYMRVMQDRRDNDRPAFDAAVAKARRVLEGAR
jgi:hypothetical protein